MSSTSFAKPPHKIPSGRSMPSGNQLPPLPSQSSNSTLNGSNVPPLPLVPPMPTVEPFPLATPTFFTVSYGTTPARRFLVNNDCRIHVILDYIRARVSTNIKNEIALKRKDISQALGQVRVQEELLTQELRKVKDSIAASEAIAAAALVNASLDGEHGISLSRPPTTVPSVVRSNESTSTTRTAAVDTANKDSKARERGNERERERSPSKGDREGDKQRDGDKNDKSDRSIDRDMNGKDEMAEMVLRRKSIEDMLVQLHATESMVLSLRDRLGQEENVLDSIVDVQVVDNFNNIVVQRFLPDVSSLLQVNMYEDPFLAAAHASQSVQTNISTGNQSTGKGSTGAARLRGLRENKESSSARGEAHSAREHDHNGTGTGTGMGASPVPTPTHMNGKNIGFANANARDNNGGSDNFGGMGTGISSEVTVTRPTGDRATAAQTGVSYRIAFIIRNTPPNTHTNTHTATISGSSGGNSSTPTASGGAGTGHSSGHGTGASPFIILPILDLSAVDAPVPTIPRFHVNAAGVVVASTTAGAGNSTSSVSTGTGTGTGTGGSVGKTTAK